MAAEEIKAILQGREKVEQERIVRWVTESLGLVTMPVAATGHAMPTPPSSSPHTGHHMSSAAAHAKDIKVFVDEKKPKSDMQFATVVAYYHSFEVDLWATRSRKSMSIGEVTKVRQSQTMTVANVIRFALRAQVPLATERRIIRLEVALK
jgi:hypothetical protein